MDVARLSDWLRVFAPRMLMVDNLIFVDPWDRGADGIRQEASRYGSLAEAQGWLNIILLESFIDEVVGDEWSFDEAGVEHFLSLVEQSWRYQIAARWPATTFRIERIVAPEDGDLGLRLCQD